jgi:hypothetical protein
MAKKAEMTPAQMADYAARMLKDAPQPGTVWRNYEGWYCRVVSVGLSVADHEPTVGYVQLDNGVTWFRPISHFREDVTHAIEGTVVQRFTEDASRAPAGFAPSPPAVRRNSDDGK